VSCEVWKWLVVSLLGLTFLTAPSTWYPFYRDFLTLRSRRAVAAWLACGLLTIASGIVFVTHCVD
jgi:hypothetical protein